MVTKWKQSKFSRGKHSSPNERPKSKRNVTCIRFILWGMFRFNLMLAYITPMLWAQSNNRNLALNQNNRICHLTCCSVCTFIIVHRIIVCFLLLLYYRTFPLQKMLLKPSSAGISQNQSLCFSRHFQHASTHAYAYLLIKRDSYTSSLLFHHNLHFVIIGYWLMFRLRDRGSIQQWPSATSLLQVPRVHSPQAIWSITNFYTSISSKFQTNNPCVCVCLIISVSD